MATNTRTECAILIAFPPQQWLQERASMLRYTYTDCIRTLTVLLRHLSPCRVLCHENKPRL